MAAFSGLIAEENDLRCITDSPDLHGTSNGWTLPALAGALLDFQPGDEPAKKEVDDIATLYASIAIETVVPASLAQIPVDRIIKARRKLAVQFDSFRRHLESSAEVFASLVDIESPEVLRARLELAISRDLAQPIADLERDLRQFGLEPGRAVLGLKSLELPAVAAAAATGLGIPAVVGQAGLVAAQVLGSTVRAKRAAEERRRGAAGYLLGLQKELRPRGVLERIRATFARVNLSERRPLAP